ncbi:hypothetical protein [Vibrio campbellii]|nr:hypothetical protein [Vibrio campbellii]
MLVIKGAAGGRVWWFGVFMLLERVLSERKVQIAPKPFRVRGH